MQSCRDAVTTAVCGDSSVEIFRVFFGGVFVGFNGYIEVGLSTTEGVDAVKTRVITAASGGAWWCSDLTGARSVAVSVDAEDSIGALIDG